MSGRHRHLRQEPRVHRQARRYSRLYCYQRLLEARRCQVPRGRQRQQRSLQDEYGPGVADSVALQLRPRRWLSGDALCTRRGEERHSEENRRRVQRHYDPIGEAQQRKQHRLCPRRTGPRCSPSFTRYQLDNYQRDLLDCAGAGKKASQLIIILPSTLVAVLCAVVGTYCFWRWRRKQSAAQERYHSETIYLGKGANESDDPELPLFKLGVIMEITNNFSESNKLGQGGFGPVYKGTLPGEQDVAVKRLSQGSKQGYEEFMNEVKLIAKLQHKNLVQLLGCCVEREERILIYEYMPNKSLDKFLFDPTLSTQLVWEKRFEIMVGIARGLQYLHQESRLKVIHRDLKTGNILLDGALNPKISDFGLARAFSGDHTQVNTHRVVGTFGYMPPEYAMEGRYSTKSDVFSFGVIVLEIVSGQKMTTFHNVEYSLNLLGHAWKLWNEERGVELLDPILDNLCHIDQLMKCINVGLLCVQTDAADRPTMSSIVLMLSSDLAVLPKPKQPAYSYRGKLLEASSSSIESDPKTYTGSELTVTVLEAR
ncbi:G-type lectin S-receptor-like serine/threonine-protein kinase At4g03230 isoform X3 [Nymphaea colorata]|uniref:G-type lectin S-receptor-like serine/threonine-protein kinase At4g03230 isoform X3 n=1 Tax=Nymphaea colorata TaxID=210225 RepID=UPI00129E3209|nr:G-type lectin S-receptor-like serine/threonine-protein kinase At4g03230 isoform X3 [Nymphaea colorata]